MKDHPIRICTTYTCETCGRRLIHTAAGWGHVEDMSPPLGGWQRSKRT